MCFCVPVCLCAVLCVCVCAWVLVWFVLVFGHCHNVAAKGLEQQCNLQRSLVPKRERQRKRGNRERETKRERERELHRDSAIRRHGSRLALSYNGWVEVFLRSLRGLVWLPISTLRCALQAYSQTSWHSDTCTRVHLTCTINPLNSLVYFISLIAYLFYLVPWSYVQLCVSLVCFQVVVLFSFFLKSCLSAPSPLPAHLLYLFPFVQGLFRGSRKKPFYKNINANRISARPPPPHWLWPV